jgi:hypothetical protein
MPRLHALVLVGLFLGYQVAGHSLAAQAAPATDIAAGTRVRVRFDCTTKAYDNTKESCRTVTGPVTSLSAESLTINTGAAEQSVTPATLVELSVSGGEGRRTGTGALVGGLAGTLAGLVGAAIWRHENPNLEGDEPLNVTALLAVGAAGTLLGALVGSSIHYDRWRPVPSPWSAARTDRPTLGLLLTPPLRPRPGVVGVVIGF